MNLLIYVTALLLALSALSYQSLNRFKDSAIERSRWTAVLQQRAVCDFNEAVQEEYENEGTRNKKSGQNSDNKPTNPKAEGLAKINYKYLFEPPAETAALFQQVLKNLITRLYGQDEFYQTFLEQDPNILDTLFTALRESDHKEVTSVKTLEGLQLKDPELQRLFYNLVKKSPAEDKDQECKSISLIHYLTTQTSGKIRLQLTSPDILMAIYDDPATVNEILIKRYELYKQAKNDVSQEMLTEEFKSQFSGRSPFESILDYTVSKTKPT